MWETTNCRLLYPPSSVNSKRQARHWDSVIWRQIAVVRTQTFRELKEGFFLSVARPLLWFHLQSKHNECLFDLLFLRNAIRSWEKGWGREIRLFQEVSCIAVRNFLEIKCRIITKFLKITAVFVRVKEVLVGHVCDYLSFNACFPSFARGLSTRTYDPHTDALFYIFTYEHVHKMTNFPKHLNLVQLCLTAPRCSTVFIQTIGSGHF